jgi:hypothetical protein
VSNNNNKLYGKNYYGFPIWLGLPKIKEKPEKKIEETEEAVDPWDFVVDLHEGDINKR